MVYFHGGGFIFGNRDQGLEIILKEKLLANNYAVVSADYRLLNQSGSYDIVKDSVVSYGDYDSRMALWRFLARNRLVLYEVFGFDPAKKPEKLERYTLTNNVKSPYPPTLIIHAKNDYLVDLGQVNAFYDFLQDKKVEAKLYLVENGHSSELINQNPDAVDEIIAFLDSRFKR